jgi:uncharacterized C2H2 Zn-finger protein
MAEKIVNYEDNIFFLLVQVKAIRDGVRLDIDARYFGQKLVQDLLHIASVTDDIFKPLKTNIHLLKRHNYLKDLKRLKKQYIELVDDIIENKVQQAHIFAASIEKLREIKKAYSKDLLDIKNLLPKSAGEHGEEEHMVSEEEIKFLLVQDEENT